MATIEWGTSAGKWSEEAKWVGGSKPGAGDDVVFASTSANCEIAAEAKCRSLVASAYKKTLTVESELKIGTGTAAPENKALVLGSEAKVAGPGEPIVFVSTTGETETITTAGVTLPTRLNFEGVGGKWKLEDSLTLSSLGALATLEVSKGTFESNGQTIKCQGMLISGAETRTVSLGASEIIINGTWDATTTTNLTFTPGTSTIKIEAESGEPTFTGGGLTYATVVLGSAEGAAVGIKIEGNNKFGSLKALRNSATAFITLEENSVQTLTAADLGNNNLARAIWASAAKAKLKSAAALTPDWVTFKGVKFEGTGSLVCGPHSKDEGENEGIEFETEHEQADVAMGSI